MSAPFLSIVGIGEDGVAGLSAEARGLVEGATLVMGGARHLALVRPLIASQPVQEWPSPIAGGVAALVAARPAPVVALASGDPFFFGIGPLLAEAAPGAWRCLPAPSCLTLACARLGWAAQDVEAISFCGRPLAPLAARLQDGARLFALSAGAQTPGEIAAFLAARGFGESALVVLEALGGPRERVRAATAGDFHLADIHPLNVVALTLRGAGLPLGPILPDEALDHDGQITKQDIRAVTIAALAPRRGDLLWDVGAGAGSIAAAFLRAHPANRAIAIERDAARLARLEANATRLGVAPRLVLGAAPAALEGLPPPDAVFLGGGASEAVIELAWAGLRPGGRLVANAVTLETEALLIATQARLGGTLTRLGVERLAMIGGRQGFRPAMTVTQYVVVKR